MTPLNNQQKQLLFDYCSGLSSEKQTAEAEQLINSNPNASELYSGLTAALSPLNNLEHELCPDELVESTVYRLNNLARSSQLRLEQLLAAEQIHKVTIRTSFWRKAGEILATAAMIVVVAGVLIAPLKHARADYWQKRCQAQLSSIWRGIREYRADHDGNLPAVATSAGAPWWKVGYNGNENHSNTRHLWLLVKGEYVNPADFVCPGRSQGRALQFDITKAKEFNDFPARRYITYSFRIRCDNTKSNDLTGRKVLIADLNPIFEKLPENYSGQLRIQLNEDMLNINSSNHKHRGQNVLFCDGSVDFKKKRNIGISDDDIFTLQNTNVYQGVEVPSCETDAFLAP